MTRRRIFAMLPVLALAAATGCNVPEPPLPRGAGHVDAAMPEGDAASTLDGSSPRLCGRGVVVAESDYLSTNVALLAEDGRVLSQSIASSATASVGLTAPLSGDVETPTAMVHGDHIVLIDAARDAGHIVWVDIATAATAQKRELSVNAGFFADPYDYVELSPTKAYVARYGSNRAPGQHPFDRGSDLLVIDPSVPSIVASIDMTPALGRDANRLQPEPARIVVADTRAFVLLQALSPDFSATSPSRLAVVDTATDTLTDTLTLDGFANCGGLALSPSKKELAVLCSGNIPSNAPSDFKLSGVVVVDITGTPRISKTFEGQALAPGPPGFYGDYATDSVLVFQTFGYFGASQAAAVNDNLIRLNLATGDVSTVLESAGVPFTLGGVACDALCRVCFAADASRQGGVVHRFVVDGNGELGGDRAVKVETDFGGLPPRYLGKF